MSSNKPENEDVYDGESVTAATEPSGINTKLIAGLILSAVSAGITWLVIERRKKAKLELVEETDETEQKPAA